MSQKLLQNCFIPLGYRNQTLLKTLSGLITSRTMLQSNHRGGMINSHPVKPGSRHNDILYTKLFTKSSVHAIVILILYLHKRLLLSLMMQLYYRHRADIRAAFL